MIRSIRHWLCIYWKGGTLLSASSKVAFIYQRNDFMFWTHLVLRWSKSQFMSWNIGFPVQRRLWHHAAVIHRSLEIWMLVFQCQKNCVTHKIPCLGTFDNKRAEELIGGLFFSYILIIWLHNSLKKDLVPSLMKYDGCSLNSLISKQIFF